MNLELANHRLEFVEQGYTIFKSVFDENVMTEWQEIAKNRHSDNSIKKLYGNFFETNPEITLKMVANHKILDFLETIWGPFIQLDSLTLSVMPPKSKSTINDDGDFSWHRDPYSYLPVSGCYEKPLAVNVLIYLQDLNDNNGPFRLIPKSHREPYTVHKEKRLFPDIREKLLYLKKGDILIFHTNLIHSRSPNLSGELRSFLSVFYTLSIIKTALRSDSKEIAEIIKQAFSCNDKRILRLFGIDDQLYDRTNCIGLEEEQLYWKEWIEADKKNGFE